MPGPCQTIGNTFLPCRDANPNNTQPAGNLLGDEQEAWLLEGLKQPNATWKILALDGPVSVVVGGEGDCDAWARVRLLFLRFLGSQYALPPIIVVMRLGNDCDWVECAIHHPLCMLRILCFVGCCGCLFSFWVAKTGTRECKCVAAII